MNKWIELLLGLVLLIAAIDVTFLSRGWGIWNFWTPALTVLKGGIVWTVIGIGALFILLGISDLKG